MIAPDLLEILRCPQTGQTLAPAAPEQLAAANARRAGEGGALLTEALTTADGRWLYPVQDGIPLLLAEDARAL